ncbi:hypothetical protein [Mucilaginibacter polytrichastri]|uniref:Fibronectin type-III domain-containing protein n=1 Tax=Mucilaginibacter polytrichastri TaxID=1302689 RepID=A0A1Q6A0H7_9SPHI|nr:hypothetical protein [Mucilaginibacter polytrichastri]OKS87482.1 hypothetical protein RG47T_2943 [Mucilaginibacter polytrichastri]SFS91185.1 hypothetical protein SAMN04487890_10677 [Mucilaginibacter polytrichastri]
MKKQRYLIYTIAIFSLMLAACGGGGNNDTDPVPVAAPVKAVLVFPAQNALCTQGIVISAVQSTVTLKWNAAANADKYEINVKNLLTGVATTQTTTSIQQDVVLDIATPYLWSVKSLSFQSTDVAVSDTWKFYNAGPGKTSYAPYPAEAISPTQMLSVSANNGKVTLNWNGADVDNDISGYDLYFGTTTTPILFKSGLMDSKYDVDVSSTITYYWKIVTKDTAGNTSQSVIYQFKVN